MSHELSPRVPCLDADVGTMQQRLHELMELCTSLQRKQSQMANKIKDQDIEISRLKAKVKSLEDKEIRHKSTDKGSNDTEEMVNVLSSMEAANILSNGGAAFSTAGVSTVSGSFPTVSAIFTTVSMATPYTRRSRGITIGSLLPMRIPIISAKAKGKEKVTETEMPKKKKLQDQIDAQVAREMEEEFARENQRLSEQAARDFEIARIHDEEELKLMIEGAYQFFVDMLKQFDREDLHQLWILVKETFSIKQCTRDKEKELWVELKRIFKPDFED
nr:hypothetical protein [Tanacetum cinerariifolium]